MRLSALFPLPFATWSWTSSARTPVARVRLEATWQASGTLDGVIEETAYWLLTSGPVPFGEPADPTVKHRITAGERAMVAVRYIPASRDVTALTKLTVRSLGRSLMQSVRWANEDKIKELVEEAGYNTCAGRCDQEDQ